MRTLRETAEGNDPVVYVRDDWSQSFPWLVHGTTGAAGDYDLRLFGDASGGDVLARWSALRDRTAMHVLVHARQVHGVEVLEHDQSEHAGLRILQGADGHVTATPGTLLTVALADCAPVFVVDPSRRAVALLHAGWRGSAGGILARGIRTLVARGSTATDLRVHVGPRICGRCYEVGPEVHAALGAHVPTRPAPVDLATALWNQASEQGVASEFFTASEWCTRCDDGHFYSHRAGAVGRQVAMLGIRAA